MPARVSNAIFLPAIFSRKAYLAAHLAPLPHISATEPSELKNCHLKSTVSEFSIKIKPSAPTDNPLAQTFSIKFLLYNDIYLPSLLSIIIKSLPLPLIFEN